MVLPKIRSRNPVIIVANFSGYRRQSSLCMGAILRCRPESKLIDYGNVNMELAFIGAYALCINGADKQAQRFILLFID